MANLGSLTAAGISARNENVLALANLNFDFSLIKLEPPREFLQLGAALSPWRRNNAEQGSSHRTARKLGVLFEQVASPPEELVKAYGRRASEISQAIGARPAGKQLGLFDDHAGADATVLWAAAVSGKTAIAVALLACMLARMWDAPKATSIWVELVQKRKEQIQQTCDGSEFSHHGLVAASRQDFTRRELAEWDASTRSWLDIADTVKETEHRKMEAVLLNLSLPVDNSTDVFTGVMRVWNTAMMAMDNLCKGIPQRVYNGAVIVAITSWHLYPDVDVFGDKTKCVTQKDVLVSPGGRLTVGLEDADPESTIGVHWSLSLANLRFYGDPVSTTSHMTDRSRISFQDLTLVCLGSLFAAWESEGFDPRFDQEKGARLIIALWKSIERMAPNTPAHTPDARPPQKYGTPETRARYVLSTPNYWLRLLASAAGRLLESNVENRKTACKLVSLGARRGRSLLQECEKLLLPYFGLVNARALSQFALDESSVLLFRELAKKLRPNARCPKAIIHLKNLGGGVDTEHFATASPIRCSRGLPQDEEQLYESHVRWIPCSGTSLPEAIFPESSDEEVRMLDPNQVQLSDGILRCPQSLWKAQSDDTTPHALTEVDELHCLLENAHQRLYVTVDTHKQLPTELAVEDVISLLDSDLLNAISIIFEIYHPYSRCGGDKITWVVDPNVARDREEATPRESSTRNPKLNIVRAQWQPANSCTGASSEPYESPATRLACSLKALSVAADIWPSHTNANISLKVVERSLWSAPWIPTFIQEPEMHNISQTFSCIAMFETGDMVIPRKELKNVFAMAIRNTIYVAASLLADPGTKCLPCESRIIVGNVGRPGLSMMIPPVDPILRTPKLESWSIINHELLTADSKCTDMFDKTSLHLSFTGFEQPVGSTLKRGAQDLEACYLETVVTVFDGSDKVGDLAILRAIQEVAIVRRLPNSACSHSLRPLQCPRWLVVDSWAELLEMPRRKTCIIRVHGNALSRLATWLACSQKDFECYILPSDPCYFCVEDRLGGRPPVADSVVLIC